MRDVGVVGRGQRLRLTREPRQTIRIAREELRQHLDGDVAAEPRIFRAEHLAHAARTERGDDLVGTEAGAGG